MTAEEFGYDYHISKLQSPDLQKIFESAHGALLLVCDGAKVVGSKARLSYLSGKVKFGNLGCGSKSITMISNSLVNGKVKYNHMRIDGGQDYKPMLTEMETYLKDLADKRAEREAKKEKKSKKIKDSKVKSPKKEGK